MSLVSEFLPDRTALIEANRQRMSPDAFRRAFPTAVPAPIRAPDPLQILREENRLLLEENTKLRREVDRLTFSTGSENLKDICNAFLVALRREGYLVEDRQRPFKLDDILSPRRINMLARPRHVCWYVCFEIKRGSISYPILGRFFRRDHTSIMSGIREAPKWIERDIRLKLAADAIFTAFGDKK